MRDAFGGAFMIKIFLVFIFIYICFTAIALNYAKAFKVKNKVIEYLESHEITNLNEMTASEKQEITNFFDKDIISGLNYSVGENFCASKGFAIEDNAECFSPGIIIQQKNINPTGHIVYQDGVIYTVTTYVCWDTGFLKALLSLNGNNQDGASVNGCWEISGETRTLVKK